MESEDEISEDALAALAKLTPERAAELPLWKYGYLMEPRLPGLIRDVLAIGANASASERKRRGDLLEQVGVALFSGVKAVRAKDIESWRGPMGQHDLVVRASGNAAAEGLRKVLFNLAFDLLVEAKATAGKVNVEIMHKLCGSLIGQFQHTTRIGIFLALEGITGTATRNVSDAHLVRLLFYARTQKPVLVIDKTDLQWLAAGGNLLELIRDKLKEIENGRVEERKFEAIPLPAHLKEVFDACSVCSRSEPDPPAKKK